jgi:hypothetical protein
MPDDIEEIPIPEEVPKLIVRQSDLPSTVRELRDRLAATGTLFERGDQILVEIKRSASGQLYSSAMQANNVVMLTHDICRPIQFKGGAEQPLTLPDRVARLYLDDRNWRVRSLAGITTAPLLRADGSIVCAEGYDDITQMYCDAPPAVRVKAQPDAQDAAAALNKLRDTFKTFPFADAAMVKLDSGMFVVDIGKPPQFMETGFLTALLTAVARASLWLAPGLLIGGPNYSGSGSGKGLLARSCSAIAYGIHPAAFPAGGDGVEFDKRLGAALLEGQPVVIPDNINNRMLKSEALSQFMTERPAKVRILGFSRMHVLNSAAFVMLTGNGLTLTEDLIRRFLSAAIDAKMDNPELRPFAPGFLDEVFKRRVELLEYCLTILRWGRLNEGQLIRGRTLGSYEQWCAWVRDPLLSLGCVDPVEEMLRSKMNDPQRREINAVFTKWAEHHRSDVVVVGELHQEVLDLINPQRKSDHWLRRAIEGYVDTRIGGYVLTRSKVSEWKPATYKLLRAGTDGRDLEIGEGLEEEALRAANEPASPVTPVPKEVFDLPGAHEGTDAAPVTPTTSASIVLSRDAPPTNPSNPYPNYSRGGDLVEKNDERKMGALTVGVTGSSGTGSPPSRRRTWDDAGYWRVRQAELSRRIRIYEDEDRRHIRHDC